MMGVHRRDRDRCRLFCGINRFITGNCSCTRKYDRSANDRGRRPAAAGDDARERHVAAFGRLFRGKITSLSSARTGELPHPPPDVESFLSREGGGGRGEEANGKSKQFRFPESA